MVKLIVLVAVTFGLFPKAHTQVIYGGGKGHNGRALLADCKGNVDQLTSCVSYIEGVNDGWTAALFGKPNQEDRLCVRDGFKSGQLVDVVVAYGAVHPEVLDFGPELLVAGAIQSAFPCPKK